MKLNALQAGFNLDHIALESPEPDRLANFYKNFIMMEYKEQKKEELIMKGLNRKIILKKGHRNRLSYAGFSCRNKENLRKFKRFITEKKVYFKEFQNHHLEKGSFSIIDPDGNLISFGIRKKDKNLYKNKFCMPLQHLTLSSKNVENFRDFYQNILGFRTTDIVVDKNGSLSTCFLTSNFEHHTLACFKSSKIGIDHHAYEVKEWQNIKILCDYFSDNNTKIIWGPGRHGPGNNLFIFIEDIDKNWIEFSAELEIIHDRELRKWPKSDKTLNLWGKAIMRS